MSMNDIMLRLQGGILTMKSRGPAGMCGNDDVKQDILTLVNTHSVGEMYRNVYWLCSAKGRGRGVNPPR